MRKIERYWCMSPGERFAQPLPDPRIAVVSHIDWVPNKYSNWSRPEPDNYNRAIFDNKAIYIEGIRNQCWYRDHRRGGWFSLYYVKGDEAEVFVDYIKANRVRAFWNYKSVAVRSIIPRIDLESKRNYGKIMNLTVDERLYDLGFYNMLLDKGLDPEYLQKIVGTRRDIKIDEEIMDEEA
jgi:hypothetical protein